MFNILVATCYIDVWSVLELRESIGQHNVLLRRECLCVEARTESSDFKQLVRRWAQVP
jgi:hypothetical protein